MLNVFYNKSETDVIKKGYEIENNIQQETLHSPFDIEKHKQVFVNYLEVIIDKEGVVHYAVPSHQEWLIKKAIEILNIDRVDLYDECPDEYCFDIMSWLTDVTECVLVWNDRYIGKPNNKQISTLTMLYNNKLYSGTLPIKRLTDEQRESLLEPNSYHCGVLSSVKQVARITLCGCVHFDINDNMGFIKPTPEQIKNLHDNFCIDVEVFGDNG
jgi:hypothetical protein